MEAEPARRRRCLPEVDSPAALRAVDQISVPAVESRPGRWQLHLVDGGIVDLYQPGVA
jgi:hypothetical protein